MGRRFPSVHTTQETNSTGKFGRFQEVTEADKVVKIPPGAAPG